MATYASLRYDFGTQLTGEIPTAAIADNAVTLAKMAGGTDGNLIGFDASGDPAAIATGTAGQVLTSAGANAASAMADAAAGGKINQVVYTNYSGAQETNSIDSSWYDITNPTITITPSATDSKIYVHFITNCNMEGHATDRSCNIEIRRSISGGSSTDTLVGDSISGKNAMYTANAGTLVSGGSNSTAVQVNRYLPLPVTWLDTTHSTTSAITYGLRAATYSLTAGRYWFNTPGSTMNFPAIAWEILA
jgi:hypothetical protein